MLGRKIIIPLLGLLVIVGALIWLGHRAEAQTTPTDPAQATVPTGAPQKTTDPDDWRLTLVNPWHPLPEGYEPELTQIENGHQVDARCAAALENMLAGCRAAGLSPLICSAYRTQEKQTSLYQNLVSKLIARGYSQEDAQAKAGIEVAIPGTSEHQLGLAVDIVDLNPGAGPHPGGHRRAAMAHGPLLGVWIYPALPLGQKRDHRDHLRALALPLRGGGLCPGPSGRRPLPGGIFTDGQRVSKTAQTRAA